MKMNKNDFWSSFDEDDVPENKPIDPIEKLNLNDDLASNDTLYRPTENLRRGDVFEDIKTYEDMKFNVIFCDPPYNLGSEWFIGDDGQYKIKKSSDILNKWDAMDETKLDTLFKEGNRVLKYGGWFIMFSMDRQIGPMIYYAMKNGFTQCQSLYWYFISNFPKSCDASKMIDKKLGNEVKEGVRISFGTNIDTIKGVSGKEKNDQLKEINYHPISDLSKTFEGYKYSIAPLKQVCETILVFRKDYKNGNCIDDLIEFGNNMDLYMYHPKVSSKERNAGVVEKGLKSIHPTMKPIDLINKVTSLFKLPDNLSQTVYVPFSGSGSEIIGLLKAGYHEDEIYGCEYSEEYYEIQKARIEYWRNKL